MSNTHEPVFPRGLVLPASVLLLLHAGYVANWMEHIGRSQFASSPNDELPKGVYAQEKN